MNTMTQRGKGDLCIRPSAERSTHAHFNQNPQRVGQRSEAQTVGASFYRPIRPKCQKRRRDEV
jgi:hypothetical protein